LKHGFGLLIKFTTEQEQYNKEKIIFKDLSKIQKMNKVRLPFPQAIDFGVLNYERKIEI
jgi:hypothetical protein